MLLKKLQITGIALVALAAVTAPSAVAAPGTTVSLGKAKGLEYVRATYTDMMAQVAQDTSCPAGSSLTSGGGSISGQPADAALHESYPVAGQERWQTEGSTSGTTARKLTAYAVCGPDSTGRYSGQVTLDPGESGGNLAGCSQVGQELTGGGISSTALGIRMNAMQPVPFQSPPFWSPMAHNPGTAASEVTFHAVCSEAYLLRYRDAKVALPAGAARTAVASCRPREVVAGGGFDAARNLQHSPEAVALATRPRDDEDANRTPDDGWLARIYNAGSQKLELAAFAICKR